MKRRVEYIIIFFLVVSFLLLLFTQTRYLDSTHRMHSDMKRRLAGVAVEKVVTRVEKDELRRYLINSLQQDTTTINRYLTIYPNRYNYFIDSVLISDSASGNRFYAALANVIQIRNCRPADAPQLTESQYSLYNGETDLATRFIKYYLYTRNRIDDVLLNWLFTRQIRSHMELIDPIQVKLYLRNELNTVGITDPFGFKLFNVNGKLVYQEEADSKSKKPRKQNQIKASLFKWGKLDQQAAYIEVSIPYYEDYISTSIFAGLSGLTILIVLLATIVSIFTILRQRKFERLRTDFVNNMTHELKTPVSSIQLAAQRLVDPRGKLNEESKQRVLHVIGHESKRLNMLIEKVLLFSLLEKKLVRVHKRIVDANEIILEVASVFSFIVDEVGGSLDLDLKAMETWINVDEVHFTNVVFNVMENALKYRKRDRKLQLLITSDNKDGMFTLSITDNGIGIPKDALKSVFKGFFRVSTGNMHDVNGYGLGLSYVYSIIKTMDGNVYAESEKNQGTTIHIQLPYVDASSIVDEDNRTNH